MSKLIEGPPFGGVQFIDKLTPYANNARTHTEEQVDEIAAAITEFGFTNPILIDADGGVLAGHGRLLAARKLGMTMVPCIELSHLSETQKRAYILADNRLAEKAGWDLGLVSLELDGLLADGYDIGLTGFDAEFLPGGGTEGLTDPDAVPDVPETPVTVLGDVWVLGKHRLMCGDSTSIDAVERLMDGRKADALFTDPPYGYGYESNYQSKHKMMLNDETTLDFLPAAYAVLFENSAVYLCGSFQTISGWIDYVSGRFKYKNLIVWKKNNWSMGDLRGAYAGQHELIIFAHKGRVDLLGKRDTDVWAFDRIPPDIHPTQKPVELIEYALSKVASGRTLDLFGGSGSTLIACEKTNRICYMMELDPKYCDVIVNRWQDFTGKTATLEGA